MKRLFVALCLTLLATSALAFDSTRRGERIAVLRGTHDAQIAMANALRRELRARGIDAFDAERTYDEVLDERTSIADYYVEIAEARPTTEDYGGVGVAGRHADVELGIVVSRLQAELRIYDGETMELIATENLSKRKTALMPTSVGIGGGALYAVLALPFIERAQHRSVARAAARDAATLVVAAVRGE
jgi:hypothetical protein